MRNLKIHKLMFLNKFFSLLLFLCTFSISNASVIFQIPSKKDWKTRSIYQVLTDRFAKTEPSLHRCSSLFDYCGGTFKGIQRKLDYIEELGFNAIWISPIPLNTERGYHGYWAKDLYRINDKFGTSQDLKDLVQECHSRGIWVMLDVVANHMGNTFDDYQQFYPFNKGSDYHKYCLIKDYNNQKEVEYCRIGSERSSLADLDTENKNVIDGLNEWVKWVVEEYEFDAIRIDTVKHVRRDFWAGFAKASGVFSIGEVLHGDPAYVGPYQRELDSMLNFPLYFTIRDVFQYRHSMWSLEVRYEQNEQYFKDVSVLGNFIDNHDFKRFCHDQKDRAIVRNALVYVMFSHGIPIIYQGTEYFFGGGDDPFNRESMWPEIEQTKPPLLDFFRRLNRLRSLAGDEFYQSSHDQIWTNDDIHVIKRGFALLVVTNVGSHRNFVRGIRVFSKQRYVNILDGSGKDELVYKAQDNGLWWADVSIKNGEPKVYYPFEKLQPYWNEFFEST